MGDNLAFQRQNIAFRWVGLHIIEDRNVNARLLQCVCGRAQQSELAQSLVGDDNNALAQQMPGNIDNPRQSAGLLHDGWRRVEDEVFHDVSGLSILRDQLARFTLSSRSIVSPVMPSLRSTCFWILPLEVFGRDSKIRT